MRFAHSSGHCAAPETAPRRSFAQAERTWPSLVTPTMTHHCLAILAALKTKKRTRQVKVSAKRVAALKALNLHFKWHHALRLFAIS